MEIVTRFLKLKVGQGSWREILAIAVLVGVFQGTEVAWIAPVLLGEKIRAIVSTNKTKDFP
jgi:hypothetical protein